MAAKVTLYYDDGSSMAFSFEDEARLMGDVARVDGIRHTGVEDIEVSL